MERLGLKTLILDKNITKEQEAQDHQKIQSWIEDISKVKYCKDLLDVVTQAENLRIIFDFESEVVANTTVHNFTAPEAPFTDTAIRIGAQLSATRSEKEIKGVLARELCRYALCLTFENTSRPYYKHDSQAAQKWNEIVQTISNWTSKESSRCSEVIKASTTDTIEMELLASAVQMFVQFEDDKEEPTRLEVKFGILFDYFENFVLPEMKKLSLKFRQVVRSFNRTADILPSILSLEVKLSELKYVKSLTGKSLSIVRTNLPKLFLKNIQKCLQTDLGALFDAKNIFVSAEKLQSQELHAILAQDLTLNVFVTCAGKLDGKLENFVTSNFTLIVSDEDKNQELTQQLTELGLSPTKADVDYGWNDLTVDSQKLLLERKINFQNTSEFSFLDILKDVFHPEDEEVARNFNDIVDDQLLDLMIAGSDISVSCGQQDEELDEKTFQERKFIKKELDMYSNYQNLDSSSSAYSNESMSREELLKDCQADKFVIISDKPGSGKSWAMKDFAKALHKRHPTNWVSYVDMKQFTEQFKDQMAARRETEFPKFFAATVLKQGSPFEVRIFKKLYDLGKVFIFLDGLDELTPGCTDFILKQVKGFESNEGSQLWIATCEPLEVDLHKVLEYNVKFKFEELADEVCADLILGPDAGKDCQKVAKDLLDRKFMSIGKPLLCKMIADITKENRSISMELTELNIFRIFTQNLVKKWSRLQESGTSRQEVNFWTFHELMEMKSSFPSYSDMIEQDLEEFKAWTDEDILAAGLVTKNGQNFDFLHSAFRDFFVAEFILRTLRQEEVPNWFIQFLLKVLTSRRYKCIRMFLNQGIGDLSELKLSDKTVKGMTANIDEYTNISFVFGDNLEILQKFLVICLDRRRYKVVKSILVSNLDAIFASIKKSEVPISPQVMLDFMVKFLNSKCLEKLIKEKKLFSALIESCEDIEHFGRFIHAVKSKLGVGFVIHNFKGHRRARRPNIFFTFCWSKNVDRPKIQKFMKLLRGFLNVRKIMELMTSTSRWYGKRVLNEAMQLDDAEVYKVLWIEIENFYKSNESHRKFKELVMDGVTQYQSVLQTVAYSKNLKLHEAFWDLAIGTFGQEQMMSFINYGNSSFTDYFLGVHMTIADHPQIIEFTFEKLQAIFSYEQFTDIMEHKPYAGETMLYKAAELVRNIDIFTSVWNLMRKYCKSDEKFVELVCKLSDDGNSILVPTINNNAPGLFNFVIYKLETMTTRDKIKPLLTVINNSNQNIFFNINNSKVFLTVWSVVFDYLEPSEMLEILQNCDFDGNNFISNIQDKRDLIKDVWSAVRGFIMQHEATFTPEAENIQKCDEFIEKLIKLGRQHDLVDIIKLKWLATSSLRLLLSPETLRLKITTSNLFSCAYDFFILANFDSFEVHEVCWNFILKKYENREALVSLMTSRSVYGSIFIHTIMRNKNTEVINFILKVIADKFTEAQIRKLLSVKCVKGVTMMSHAVTDLKSLQVVKNVWKMHQNCFTSTEIADLIAQPSKIKSNIILDAAGSSVDIFNFLWSEAGKLCGSERLAEIVKQRNSYRKIIIHVCAEQYDIELLKVVWNEVTTILGGSLKSIVQLVEFKEQYSSEWFNDIIDLIEIAAKSNKIEFNKAVWELLWDAFQAKDELKSLILWKKNVRVADEVKDDSESSSSESECEDDNYSQCSDFQSNGKHIQEDNEPYDYNEQCNTESILSVLNQVFQCTNLDVNKFTMLNLDRILDKSEISKILRSNEHVCFLGNRSESLEKHQLLWDVYRKYLSVPDLKSNANSFFGKVLCNAATISAEIFRFTWSQAVKEAESVVIPALECDANILWPCIKHKDTDLLKLVWTQIGDFYKSQNLPASFKELVMKQTYRQNVFQVASMVKEVNVHETLWELLLSTFEDCEELKNALSRKYQFYDCLIAELFKNKDLNVVKFHVKVLQENFSGTQLQEMLMTDSRILQNCLETKATFEDFQLWWEFFRKVFQPSDKFVEFMEVNDNFVTVFGRANEQILELAFNDLTSFMTRDEIRRNLLKVKKGKNILRTALSRGNNSLPAYSLTWQYIHEYLEKEEILELLTQTNSHGHPFILQLVLSGSKEVFDIAWTEMKKILSYEDQVEALKAKYPGYGNLYQCSLTYSINSDEYTSWIEGTLREYRIRINK